MLYIYIYIYFFSYVYIYIYACLMPLDQNAFRRFCVAEFRRDWGFEVQAWSMVLRGLSRA